MLVTLKYSSLALAKQVGLSNWVGQTAWRSQRLLILCYHGVSLDDEHRWNPALYVSAARLRDRLETLRRHDCTVLPLAEAIDRLRAGDLPQRAVVLTFDDGYYDFLARAYPLLCEYRYPATVYLTTKRCEHNFPVVNLFIAYLLWLRREIELDARGIAGLDGRFPLRAPGARAAVVRRLDDHARAACFGPADKDRVARTIAERLGLDYAALLARRVLRLLSPDDVRELAARGVDFQLHTHLHRTPANLDLFTKEIRDNRVSLEAMTGRRAEHFCYPSGVYHTAYLPRLRREGIVSATTCEAGLATRNSHPLLLPRLVDTSGITELEFESWLTGAACWLPRRARAAHGPQ